MTIVPVILIAVLRRRAIAVNGERRSIAAEGGLSIGTAGGFGQGQWASAAAPPAE